ncbi:MAG: hypothetical protein A2Y62_05735 [Candidatus Fischerbacteria bacterium RBG_13_37_8]|uniref:Uncharacterized protein n=1 Tax=Candidatus Fischerbacteria bacterium RBG_13_37_8 TaxID=1817863 RepID=A0A1F5VD69_9BACT|nr:MAG: hypothetical protein A2Y62_05735 [Candidatus Fischerbacteria bacterium RBG_13_37_8]
MVSTYNYKCKKCDFSMNPGWGGYLYYEDENGERIPFSDTGDPDKIRDLLPDIPQMELIEERIGYNSYCVCLDCLKQFELDIGNEEDNFDSERYFYGLVKKKDERKCPHCKSHNVKTSLELVGKKCPKCKEGTFREKWTKIEEADRCSQIHT